jgi:phosphoribosyl-ATP pyrophosphohydrolase
MKLEQHFLSKIKEELEEYGFCKQEEQYNNMYNETDMTGYALYVLKNDKVISPKEWKETLKKEKL